MDLAITGRTALVLGAGGGLGRAIAVSLGREGVKVALAGRTKASLEATAGTIAAAGGTSLCLPWDIGDLAAIDGNVAQIESALGPVDILVNNSGGPPPTTAAGVDPALWSEQFRTMVVSIIAITDRVLPGMRERRWGRIITSTSSGVIAPIPGLAISNALRQTLVGWSKTLAREVAADGVTANVVLPGRIATDRLRFLDETKAKRANRALDDVVEESLKTIPIGRYGRPEEYGDTVAFLASERASYITGSVVRVDGGTIPTI